MSDDTVTRAWSFGCPSQTQPDDAMAEQFRLANDLWNALVEIWRGHEDAKAAIWATDPAVTAAQRDLSDLTDTAKIIRQRMRGARSQDRTTVPREDDAAALASLKNEITAAAGRLREARDAASASLRDAFAEALTARHAAVKATYADFVQQRGLGWGTWNDITRRRFPAAIAAAEKRRKDGQPAELRFRRFDGTGTLTIQVQRGAGCPPRTIPALNSGAHPRSGVLRMEPWADPAAGRLKGSARHGTLTVTAGRGRGLGPLTWQIPVTLDLCLPAAADVAEVKISRRRCAGRYRLSVSVVASAAPATSAGSAAVAVRLGWGNAGGGWLRVASIGSSAQLTAPGGSLEGIVRIAASGLAAEVLIPPAWRRLLERDDMIRSVRDQNLDVIKAKVADTLAAEPALARDLGVTAADVARWRAPRRLVALARAWPAGHPLAATLEEWRSRDRHLWEFECNERAQVLARRRHAWRNVAAWLCSQAREVTMDALDIAAARRVPDLDHEDPEFPSRRGREQSQDAAPGELRAAITAAANARGVKVVTARRVAG